MKWLIESNRQKHALLGLVIYGLWILFFALQGVSIYAAAVTGLCCVTVAMLAVEYGQKTCGSKFDWLDVVAGDLIPTIITMIILFV